MESKTPLADRVRKLEIARLATKALIENLGQHAEAAPNTDFLMHSILTDLPNLIVTQNKYLNMLQHNIVVQQRKLDDLEHKLTAIYVALEDC